MLLAVAVLFGNICIYKKRKQIEDTILGSYMEACCLWQLFLFSVTELLSVFHVLRFRFLLLVWGGLDIFLILLFWIQWRQLGISVRDVWNKGRRTCMAAVKSAPWYGILIVLGLIVMALSLFTTPHNWDSMTYHLPRIAYWAQNQSVAHYATHSIRQIASPVLAEFVNLHVYLLCRRHDLFFNLLQAASYLTCAVFVGGIAHKLSCDKRFRFLAMLLFMTMPIAYAESLTTQVDNFAAIWLVFFVYRLLDYTDVAGTGHIRFDKVTVMRVCAMGLCVAWGYLTKPSVCVGMVVFALWLLILCIRRRDNFKELVSLCLCALPCVALPMVPEILRNFQTFGSYASESAGAAQLVGTLQPSYLFVNLLKNLSFNLPTPFVRNGHLIFREIAVQAAALLGVDLDAVSISEAGRAYMLHEAGTYGCDTAVNPIVMWLFLLCAFWMLVWAVIQMIRRSKGAQCERAGKGYFWTATLSFLFFCTILRWEPFVSRYMIAYLALLCPAIAFWLQRRTEKVSKVLRYCILSIVSLLCLVEAANVTRFHFEICKGPARTRPYSYFAGRWDEMSVYSPLVDEITAQGYQTVGLYLRKADDFEYPFWAMLRGRRLEHILVENESARYADERFTPDCIIWFGTIPEELPEEIKPYQKITEFGNRQYLMER